MKKLVIVESPAKARTIKRYLGKDFEVLASIGHIRDLPKSKIGVEVEEGFQPNYVVPADKKKIVTDLKKHAAEAETVYIATDPDREGEAIGWHISELIKVGEDRLFRVLFQEITKGSVKKAIDQPGHLNMNLVEAQQTRRILDRLVGYNLSPLLWKKVRRGLSAGRVQSVALKMICDRERERKAFVPEEYWTFNADLVNENGDPLRASLDRLDGKKARIENEKDARTLEKLIKRGEFVVDEIKKKAKQKNPSPPFTTAKLQQESHRRFRFPVKKTMKTAQALYEGKNLGDLGHQGLITYMRTDSVRVASSAVEAVRTHIEETFGQDFLPSKPRTYSNKSKVQDAHEAIRPANMDLTPEKIQDFLTPDEYKLYSLIYKRFLASQMKSAQIDHTEVGVLNGNALFKAQGEVITFPGFLEIYREAEGNSKKSVELPPLKKGENLDLKELEVKQNFTQPPARFTEATLVKALEEKGIGRPSTYAAIISTIQNKDYTVKEEQNFVPTSLGEVVTDFLTESFPEVINESYTAGLEKVLDQIELGSSDRSILLGEFWPKFETALGTAENREKIQIPIGEDCPECGKPLIKKWGKAGEFIACSGYPDCTYTRNVVAEDAEPCENCGADMVLKRGRFGSFYACSNYPDCKTTRSTRAPFKSEDTGVSCSTDGCEGTFVSRRSKRGRIFYGCSRYPDCQTAIWNRPVLEKCPVCGHPYMVVRGKNTVCPEEKNHK